MAQERIQKTKAAPQETKEVEEVKVKASETAEALKDETDAFLDEIDELLADIIGESTAQEVISGYIQKGTMTQESLPWFNQSCAIIKPWHFTESVSVTTQRKN